MDKKYNIVFYREVSNDGWIDCYLDIFQGLLTGQNWLYWQLKNVGNYGAWLVVNRSDFDLIPKKYQDDFKQLLKIKYVYLTDDQTELKNFIEMFF